MDGSIDLVMLSGDRELATGRRGVFHGVLAEIASRFDHVDVITPAPRGPVRVLRPFENVRLHPCPGGRARRMRHILQTASEIRRERNVRLVASHDYGLFVHGRAAMRLRRLYGWPFVSEIHHVPGYPRPAGLAERLEFLLARWYVGRARDEAVAFRVVNRVEAPALLRRLGVPDDKIRVVPSLYLDLERFSFGAGEPLYDVLMVGRLVPNKRFDLVLRAAALLLERGRPLRLRLIGEGPMERRWLGLAARLGLAGRLRHDRYLESVDDLVEAYRTARVLVCASTSEGGPRVTCEAMACGTPVVTTPVGLMPEIVEDGVSGFLFRWDPRDLARAIERILDDERLARSIAREARRRVEPFERSRTLTGYASFLRGLAEEAA